MKVSFSGVYDIRFPQNTKDEEIQNKFIQTKEYIDKTYNQKLDIVDIRLMDSFNIQKTDKKLTDKGIRISTSVDAPAMLCDIFDKIDKNLGQQYVDKSKVELVLDTKA